MNFKDLEFFVRALKTRPFQVAVILVAFLLISIITVYLEGFFGEKGKKHATSTKAETATVIVPYEAGEEKDTNDDKHLIYQHTQGDQSPSIISEGDVKIQYDTQNETKTE